MGGWFAALFERLLGERLLWLRKVDRRKELSDAVTGLASFLRDGAAYAYLIYRVLAGDLSVGDFTLYFGTVAGFSAWLSDLAFQMSELSRLALEIDDARAWQELPDRVRPAVGLPLPERDEWPVALSFSGVSFSYPDSGQLVLDDVDLQIKPGERLALVGPNGAGKSTCVKLLCGLYRPKAGRVLLNGQDAVHYDRDGYFDLFTAVFQDIHLLPVSVARNVAPDMDTPLKPERVRQCLELAGLWDKINGLPQGMDTLLVKEVNDGAVEFSGGELQRLLLARALYKDAPVLILDEPTAALDPIAENELYMRYNALTTGKTSIFISHRLASTRFCDRIVFLDSGKIVESGTHHELMQRNGKYAEMFRIQSHYYRSSPLDQEKGGELL